MAEPSEVSGATPNTSDLTDKEQESLAAVMTTYTEKLRDAGWAGMNFADAIALSLQANAARNKAEDEKNRVLSRIAKARSRQPADIFDVKDGKVWWRAAED